MSHKTLSRSATFIWTLLTLGSGMFLHALHRYELPQTHASLLLKRLSVKDEPQQVHILYTRCGCSRIVAEELNRHPRSYGKQTYILIAENPDEPGLFWADFQKHHSQNTLIWNLHQAEEAGILASPQTLFFKNGQLQWQGGYRDGIVNPYLPLMDIEIAQKLTAGDTPVSLPIIGCASSQKIRELQDPLGLKLL